MGRPPLLLLDDVFSELDPQRRGHLVRRIGGLPQAFVTTTALDDLDPALVAASTAWQVDARPAGACRVTRRPMRRLSDLLPDVATHLGIEAELRRRVAVPRPGSCWSRSWCRRPRAAATLLEVRPPTLVVSAPDAATAQELRLQRIDRCWTRSRCCRRARGCTELRVVVRPG